MSSGMDSVICGFKCASFPDWQAMSLGNVCDNMRATKYLRNREINKIYFA